MKLKLKPRLIGACSLVASVAFPAIVWAQGVTTTYGTLIDAMKDEISDFQNNFAIPATVALLGLLAVLSAIRWVRGMFRAAT